jgi:diketogulonate reductase-like aldo/keto reductase
MDLPHNGDMEKRGFGSTGVEAPVIGQGTWEIGREAVGTLRAGLDLGMTHIDTAEMYGNGRAEELVGEAIAGRRDEVFLASKVLPSNASYEGTLRACERSLARLGTDRLDLYLLHWSGSHPIEETMRALERLIDRKQIRFAGVSNLDVDELKAAQAGMRHYRLACNQVLYHPGERGIERKLIPYCAEHEIAVVAYTPFGQQNWERLRTPGAKVLREIAQRNGRTVRQVILNFVTRLPHVFTIPKADKLEHMRENAGGVSWRLSADDVAAIDRAFPALARDVPLAML